MQGKLVHDDVSEPLKSVTPLGKSLPADDRAWLLDRLADLEAGYAAIPAGRPWCAVHGDAWSGNIAGTAAGPVLLDLERFAYGPPEWDLASIAVSFTTFGSLSAEQWQDFSDRYGYDVLAWEGFELLRDIRELRKVTFAWQLAETSAAIAEHARHRLACCAEVVGHGHGDGRACLHRRPCRRTPRSDIISGQVTIC